MESADGRYLMVAEANCRYKAPAHFEEEIIVRTGLAKASDRVIRYRYEICNKRTGQLLATGETAHIITNLEHRPARLPQRYHKYFNLPVGN
jgi:acyl-CoA thioester hydrolase